MNPISLPLVSRLSCLIILSWCGTATLCQAFLVTEWNPRSLGIYAFINDALAAGGQVVAVGESGAILTSRDGSDWTSEVSNTSDALRGVAYGNGHFVAVGALGTIVRSSDGGISWERVSFREDVEFNQVTFGNGLFVAVGMEYDPDLGLERGSLFTSSDGAVWKRASAQTPRQLNDVVYGAGRFVAVGGDYESGWIMNSPDGRRWTCSHSRAPAPLMSVTHGDGLFVVAGLFDIVGRSLDGENWTFHTVNDGDNFEDFRQVMVAEGCFAASAFSGAIYFSADARHWRRNEAELPLSSPLLVSAFDTLIALSEGDTVYQSETFTPAAPGSLPRLLENPSRQTVSERSFVSLGVTVLGAKPIRYQWRKNGVPISGATQRLLAWSGAKTNDSAVYSVTVSNALGTATSDPVYLEVEPFDPLAYWDQRSPLSEDDFGESLGQVVYGNGTFVGASLENQISVSSDGASWGRVLPPFAFLTRNLVFADGRFILNGWDGAGSPLMLVSTNGIYWVPFPPPEGIEVVSIAYGNGRYVALSYDSIWTATDWEKQDWVAEAQALPFSLRDIAFGDGVFVIIGEYDVILASTDGLGWRFSDSSGLIGYSFGHVVYGNGAFVVTGPSGAVFRSSDGLVWEQQPLRDEFGTETGVACFGGGIFVVVSMGSGSYYSSADGVQWETHTWPVEVPYINSLAFGNGTFVAVGDGNLILQSAPLLDTAPALSRAPVSRNVEEGEFVTFRMIATGSPELVYRWYRNGQMLCATNGPHYTIEFARREDAGEYWAVISNGHGTIQSEPFRLGVETYEPSMTIRLDASGAPVFTLFGRIGWSYPVEYTESLQAPIAWKQFKALTLPSSPFHWRDPEADFVPRRFYRIGVYP